MKNPFKSELESGRLSGVISSLFDKKAKLSARLADAEKAVQTAIANRSARLADADDAETETLISAVSKAEADSASLKSTLAEIDRLLTDAGDKKAVALEGERRDTEAAAMLETAAAIDKLAPKFEAAVAELSKVIGQFVDTIPADVALWPSWDRLDRSKRHGAATAPDVATALLAEAIYAVFPAAFTWDYWKASMPLSDLTCSKYPGSPMLQHQTEGRAALPTDTAVKFVSDRLRTIAAEIRAGSEVAKVKPASKPVSLVADPEIEVLVLKAFRYRLLPSWHTATRESQHRTIEARAKAYLPKTVADATIAAECAQLMTEPKSQELLSFFVEQNRRSQNSFRTSPEDVIDLGDPMGIEAANTRAA